MTPFSNGQFSEFPYPPVDIPTPDVPPADFSVIGQKFSAGEQAAGTDLKSVLNAGDWVMGILKKILAFFMGVFLDVLAWLLSQVFQVFDKAGAPMNQLFSIAISGMFGLTPPPISFGNLGEVDARKDFSGQIADKIKQGLVAGASTDASGMLQPGDTGANNFMQMAAHMAIEGWLQAWIMDAASNHYLERFGDLKDTLEQTLGVGRLARRAMAAPMKILVEDPYTWKLNQTYHPTLLAPGELVRQYLRGGIDRNALQTQMSLHGYTSDKVDALIFDQRKELAPADIFKLMTTGYMSQDTALNTLSVQGYDKGTATELLTALNQEYTNALNRKLVEEGLALVKSRKMNLTDYSVVLSGSGLPKQEQDTFSKLAAMIESTNRQRFSLAEGETLVKKGLWTLDQFRELVLAHGYQLGDETDLELLLLTEIKDAADAAAKKSAAQAAAQQRAAARLAAQQAKAKRALEQVEELHVSNAQYETLVTEGLRTLPQYRDYLTSKGVAPDNADALVTVLANKIQTKTAAASAKASAAGNAKAKNLDVTQLEAAVQQGLLSMADFTTRMEQIGMSPADAQLLAQELQHRISDAAAKAKASADAKAAAAVKHVDTSQEERAVLLGTQTIAQYAAFLDGHGFAPEDRDVLVSELSARLTQAQAAAAKKAAAAKTAASKGINLTQLERLVRAGIKTAADYQTALAKLGYSAEDQAAMVQYLQLQMEQDQQDLITKGHAAALVDKLGVSLADLERAVKLSVVPISTYQDALQRAGVPAADQPTMVQTLAAQIKTTRAQQTAASSVSKQVAAAGVSLATLEKDTEAGRLSIEQFQGLLAGYGVPESQITDVVQLVQDMIDNQKAVQALVAQATARAAAKGLNLAQDTAAYKQGVMDETTWRSRVASLGYDAADVEILFETLAAAQAAAAAKSAKKTTTSTTAAATTGTSAGAAG